MGGIITAKSAGRIGTVRASKIVESEYEKSYTKQSTWSLALTVVSDILTTLCSLTIVIPKLRNSIYQRSRATPAGR